MNRNGNNSNGIWENWVVVTPAKVDFGEISSDKNEVELIECSVKIQNIRSHGIKLNFQGRVSIIDCYGLNIEVNIKIPDKPL